MNDMKAIIERIKNRRQELDMSYQDLANKTGLSKSTLQRYETGGIGNLPLDKLEIIAKALNVTPSFIMGWEDAPEPEEPEINTIAAHALEDLTEEEQEKVLEYAKFIKSTRGKNEK